MIVKMLRSVQAYCLRIQSCLPTQIKYVLHQMLLRHKFDVINLFTPYKVDWLKTEAKSFNEGRHIFNVLQVHRINPKPSVLNSRSNSESRSRFSCRDRRQHWRRISSHAGIVLHNS
jgi:hypothetical protein